MAGLEVGELAPDFALQTDKGTTFRLGDHRGRPVVLVFYPQDDTEGCTLENIEFTQLMPEFRAIGVEVLGISPDSVEDHCRFRDKYQLGLTLAADPQRDAVEAYGIWGEKTLYGRDYVGLIRTTFLVGADGRIAGKWPATRIKGHAQAVLEATRRLLAV